jgi:hypothetical protein
VKESNAWLYYGGRQLQVRSSEGHHSKVLITNATGCSPPPPNKIRIKFMLRNLKVKFRIFMIPGLTACERAREVSAERRCTYLYEVEDGTVPGWHFYHDTSRTVPSPAGAVWGRETTPPTARCAGCCTGWRASETYRRRCFLIHRRGGWTTGSHDPVVLRLQAKRARGPAAVQATRTAWRRPRNFR